ncbi:MAG TPA: ATP-binding cassette domain-containing protein, partial [Jiangellaceae bacterium]|nr:ATP-binding cassette domain-containing protein [Jiangellaceae bacterium]
MSDPVLEVHDLVVAYGHVQAVRGVSFHVPQGSLVTLIGANGAGKTSTLAAVSGLLRPRSGRVIFQGRDVTRWAAHKLV